jgi:hypothetical protein
VKRISVQVREDHLALLSRARPMLAMAELIWNAFDADATDVRVVFDENDLGGLDAVRIQDNGHGLDYERALVVFQNLGGSWKEEGMRSPGSRRLLHGKYGKGRFRAFTLGNHVTWDSVYVTPQGRSRFALTGKAATIGEFDLTEPESTSATETGLTVAIRDVGAAAESLRGIKALQEVTDLFALYLHQYPGLRLMYDGVPIDPANAEYRHTDIDLGEVVTTTGQHARAVLTIVEWTIPGKRGFVLCDEHGFALHVCRPRLLFRGFSYTAYLKCPIFATLDREGLLQMEEMSADVQAVLEPARVALRRHFSLREAQRNMEVLDRWKEDAVYPYEGVPSGDREDERRIFDIYATHLSQLTGFSRLNTRNKRLILRLVQELVRTEPTRVAHILDELLTFPEAKEEEVLNLLGA